MNLLTPAYPRRPARAARVSFRSLPSVLSFVLLVILPAHAQVSTTLVDDNFDTLSNAGARDANGNYSTATQASTWRYVGTNGLSTSAVSVSSATGNFSGNAIRTNFNGVSNVGISTFSSTTLGVSDSISVSFDFRYVSDPTDNNRSPQFGLFNGTAPTADMTGVPAVSSGYNVDMSESASANSALKKGLFDPFAGASNVAMPGSGFTPLGYSGTAAINFTFVLTRTTATSIVASLYLNGSSTAALTGTDSSATDFTFNEFIIRARGTAEIDNFTIVHTSAIPEPSSMTLVAGAVVGFVAMTVVRRRRP